MDEHRDAYREVRSFMLEWIENLDSRLQKIDPDYAPTPANKAITRINNNLVYQPNAPTYRNYIGTELNKGKRKISFYVHVSIKRCFIDGGFYRPASDILKSIREAIDYDGEEFKKIIGRKSFVDTFGSLDDEDTLKAAPKGFSTNHPHADLLRLKSFTVVHPITQQEIMADGFTDKVVSIYQEILPFKQYLEQAVSV